MNPIKMLELHKYSHYFYDVNIYHLNNVSKPLKGLKDKGLFMNRLIEQTYQLLNNTNYSIKSQMGIHLDTFSLGFNLVGQQIIV